MQRNGLKIRERLHGKEWVAGDKTKVGFGGNKKVYRLNKVIVRDLREEMMDNVGANVMVNVVDPAIVTIHSCKTSS